MSEDANGPLQQYLASLHGAREVFRAAWDAIAIYDLDGRIVDGNAAARDIVGAPLAAGLQGRHYSAHMPPGAERGAAKLFAQVVVSGEPVDTELTFRDAEGRAIPVAGRLVPIKRDGKVIGVLGFARDVSAQRTAEARFLQSERQFRAIFENHPDSITMLDLDGKITRINAGGERLTGYSAEELVGQTPDMLSPTGVWPDRERIIAKIAAGEAVEFETPLKTKGGERKTVAGRAVPLAIGQRIRGFYLLATDVTEERRRERLAAREASRIADLYRIAASASFDHDERIASALTLGMRELRCDFAYVASLADGIATVTHTAGTGASRPVGYEIVVEQTLLRHALARRDIYVAEDLTKEPWRSDLRAPLPWRSYVAYPLEHEGTIVGLIAFMNTKRPIRVAPTDRDYVRALGGLISSVAVQLERERRLDTLAFHDPLTGLPNRALLHDRLEQTLLVARRHNRGFAVHYIDVDHFKTINDTYGHAVGDVVLVGVAHWLRSLLRESDTIARIGGDEFVVIQPAVDSTRQAEELAARLVSLRDHPIAAGGREHRVTLSIGCSVFPADAANPVELLRSADKALYTVKEGGRDGYAVGLVAALSTPAAE